MEQVLKPLYPVAFVFPVDGEPVKPEECILCYTVPQSNSKVLLQGKSYRVVETPTPEYVLVKLSNEEEKWLVPLLTLKLIPST